MSLYFRPIVKDDKSKMARVPNSHITNAPLTSLTDTQSHSSTVNSKEIFGVRYEHTLDEKYTYDDEFTRVGYIDLNERIINPFLAGRNLSAWSIISGLSSTLLQSIVKYETVFDLTINDWVPTNQISDNKYSKSRYLLGVDAIMHTIERNDFKQMILDKISTEYLKKLRKATGLNNLEDCIEFISDELIDNICNPEDYDIPVFHINSGYVLNLNRIKDQLMTEEGKPNLRLIHILYNFSEGWDDALVSETPDQFNEISILHKAHTDGHEFITNQIMSYLFVLPIGYRPELSIGQNKITVQYNEIVKWNSNVADVKRRSDNTIHSITRALRELYDSIVKLMVNKSRKEKSAIEMKKDRDYKSLAETLKGKEGFIRDRLEGARIDFSGRTVITLDPTLPIDTIGVPIKILEKIANPVVVRQFVKEARKREELKLRANMTDFINQKDSARYGISYVDFLKEVFETNDIFGLIGRQPTLFYLGIQGFKIRPVDGNAVQLSPLIVMPFNADFDGDQMHFSMPVTDAGLKDVKSKMLFRDNIWYPKNGSITIAVRHEIKYGLWECIAREPKGSPCTAKSRKEAFDGVCSGEIPVDAPYENITAGVAAFNYCIFGSNMEVQFDTKDILKAYSAEMNKKRSTEINSLNHNKLTKLVFKMGGGREGFFDAINKLVQLGFAVSKYYPPNISVLTNEATKEAIAKMKEEFNKKIAEYKEYVDLGMELESNYNLRFSNECTELTKKIKKYLLENMSEDNGYWRMVVSGAKGDDDNLLQIYGIKGQVKKNSIEAFNTTIDGNYSEQLTGLEHFVTAYGARKGISDKTLSTATPGYMSRKLEHAGAPLKITTHDCSDGIPAGEAPGLEFYPEDIIPHIDSKYLSRRGAYPEIIKGMSDEDIKAEYHEFYSDNTVYIQIEQAAELLSKILVGRHVVDDNDNALFIKDESDALSYINRRWNKDKKNGIFRPRFKPVKLRSPMSCLNPCCQICNGIDLTKGAPDTSDKFRTLPRIGRKVGFIAAQAIGEPGTQLVMKNFQSGGIVGKTNITSSFDIIEACFDLKNYTKDKVGDIILYDPVADVTGYVKKMNVGQNRSQIIITATNNPNDRVNLMNKKLIINNSVELKRFVRKGDTICFNRGNAHIRDIIKYSSYENGCKQLLLTLFSAFMEQDVWSIHFECIIRNMMQYTVIQPVGRYKAGDIISYTDIQKSKISLQCYPVLIGVKYLTKYRQDFLQAFAMESQTTYVPRAIVSSSSDDLNDPIIKTALGLYLD